MVLRLSILLFTVMTSSYSFAAEPSYCNPKVFFSKEVKMSSRIKRAHVYKLGDTLLMGAAVGESDTNDLIQFESTHSNAAASNKYCTWYLNEGNSEAEQSFTHIYLNNPKGLTTVSGPAEYGSKLKETFANGPVNFLKCATDHNYIAMGCNGQKHRGPTAFGMLLAFSGCSVENAANIVNTTWGLNGVQAEVRAAIIAEGQRLGDADPEARRRLQQAFGL
ncbi:MAG: hypothetical protein H7256_12640 [Bdellovibrio sp.]|nr:hypothetical protein [Bdellovibrio sp.]